MNTMTQIFLTIGIVICGFSVCNSTAQPVVTNNINRDWQIDTNCFFSDMEFGYETFRPPEPWHDAILQPPICCVFAGNRTTNAVLFLQMPPTNLFSIELLDSHGKPVGKTREGKMYGLSLTQKYIANWRNKQNLRPAGMWYLISPNDTNAHCTVGFFSLRSAFRIEQPGEYTLHLRLRLIEARSDSSGQLYFPMVWLPEVTAKVQIRPEDIPKTNPVPSGQ